MFLLFFRISHLSVPETITLCTPQRGKTKGSCTKPAPSQYLCIPSSVELLLGSSKCIIRTLQL